jgi:hypothetical protein
VEQLENCDVSFVNSSVAVAVTPSPVASPGIVALQKPGKVVTKLM